MVLTPDLDADGQSEILLCEVNWPGGGQCLLYARTADGEWPAVAQTPLWHGTADTRIDLIERLRAGEISAVQQPWPDLRIGDGPTLRLDPLEH